MKNRRFARFGRLAMTVMTAAALAFGTLAAAQPVMAEVITQDGVNIRLEASTEGDNIIGSLNEGDHVEVLDSTTGSDGAEWYLVRLDNGNQGWVRADMVGEDPEEAPPRRPKKRKPKRRKRRKRPPRRKRRKKNRPKRKRKKLPPPKRKRKIRRKRTARRPARKRRPPKIQPRQTIL